MTILSSSFQEFLNRSLPGILLIILAGFLSYSNTFHVPFVLDDKLAIVDNQGIRGLKDIYGGPPTRILAYFTFALNYHFGGLEVAGYHAVNLCIHLITALLVYWLVRLTFRTPFLRGSRFAPRAGLVALLAALLFVVHPVQTQAVTYIVQRIASLATMFFLLAVVLYVLARLKSEVQDSRNKGQATAGKGEGAQETHDKREGVRKGFGPGSWTSNLAPVFLLAGSVLAAVLAMKTKEISFTLPLAILLYELFFFQSAWQRRLLYLLPVMATLPIVPLTVLGIGESTGDIVSDIDGQLRPDDTSIPRLHYLFTQFRVIGTYLRLLALPANQNLDYDYPVYTTFFTPPVFLSFLLLASLMAVAIYLHRISRQSAARRPTPDFHNPAASTQAFDPALRLISFGILWFFLALSIESSLIPIDDVIFEHRLYLPSFGALAAFAVLFLLGMERIRLLGIKLTIVIAGIMVASLALATFQRNHVWGDDVRLWQDVVRKSPAKARPYNNLGVALTEAGRYREAIEILAVAIEVKPSHPHAYNNLGRAYILTDQTRAALPLLNRAILLDPNYVDAHINLAAALNIEGKFSEAIQLLERKYSSLKGKAEVHFQLGVAYALQGNREAARRELAIVSRLDPGLASHLAGLPGMGVQVMR
jgi:protein O-mannosyl-transferase